MLVYFLIFRSGCEGIYDARYVFQMFRFPVLHLYDGKPRKFHEVGKLPLGISQAVPKRLDLLSDVVYVEFHF